MKKLVALLTAGVLCLGMGMTVLAQEAEVPSRDTGDEPSTNPPSTDPADHASAVVNGKTVEVTYDDIEKEEVLEIVNDNKKLEQVLKNAGYDVKPGQTVEGVFWADVNLKDKTVNADGKIDLNLCIGALKTAGLKDKDTVYVYHWGKNGLEIYEAKVKDIDGNGYIDVTLNGLSPIAVVKVTSNGSVVAVDKKGNVVATVDKKGNVVSTVKTAPKTGEF